MSQLADIADIDSKSGALAIGTAGATRLHVDGSGKVGIGTTTPRAALDVSATDSLRLPVGTDAQRPAAPTDGMLRFSTTAGAFEGYMSAAWRTLSGTSGTFYAGWVRTFTVSSVSSIDVTGLDRYHIVTVIFEQLRSASGTTPDFSLWLSYGGTFDTSSIYGVSDMGRSVTAAHERGSRTPGASAIGWAHGRDSVHTLIDTVDTIHNFTAFNLGLLNSTYPAILFPGFFSGRRTADDSFTQFYNRWGFVSRTGPFDGMRFILGSSTVPSARVTVLAYEMA